jgi:hypothetical protein
MENFFYDDIFCTDIEDLMWELGIDEETLLELEDTWEIECEETTLEKIFVVKKEFATDAILNKTDTWEDRFPEDSDYLYKQIKTSIDNAIDIDKLNEGLPSLYYPNGKRFKINKSDLVGWVS